MKIAFAKPYEECIDQKATIAIMRQHLAFLYRYAYLLENYEKDASYVEDESVLDYLSYTKSVIDIHPNQANVAQSTKLLQAIEKYDKQKEQKRLLREERRMRCLWLMQGILVLPEIEKKAMLYKYVHHMEHEQIIQRMHHISISTLHRVLKRAYINLAQILEIEVLKES